MGHRIIVQYDVEDIGIDHSQYFVGRSTTFTKWDAVAVGIGENAFEAFEDACQSLADQEFESVDELENPFNEDEDNSVELGWNHATYCPMSEDFEPEDDDDISEYECNCEHSDESELWYHVAIWVREADGFEPRKGDDLSIRNPVGDREVIAHTFVDQVHSIGEKYGKPYWCVEDHVGRHFFAHDPFADSETGDLSWLADEYDRKVYEQMAKDMGITLTEA